MLYPNHRGGWPRTFTLTECREIKKTAGSKLTEHGLPFSPRSPAKPADFLGAEGWSTTSAARGLRILLRKEGVRFWVRTWKTSRDPDYATKKPRVEHLYAIADGEVVPENGEPEVIDSMDEFGPLNLQQPPPRPTVGPNTAAGTRTPTGDPRPRQRATHTRPHGVRHLFTTPTTWPKTSSTATSRRRRTGRSSWSSATTSARRTRRTCASRSSATPTHPTRRPGTATGSGHELQRTTRRSPTPRPQTLEAADPLDPPAQSSARHLPGHHRPCLRPHRPASRTGTRLRKH